MRIARVLYALLLALALGAVAAFGETPVTLDPSTGCGPVTNAQNSGGGCIEPKVAAYGGWVAWSHPDPATDDFQLALRDPQGTEFAAPVPERKAPFDVSLGPGVHGVVAVYSRCTDEVNLLGCEIVELPACRGGNDHAARQWGNGRERCERDRRASWRDGAGDRPRGPTQRLPSRAGDLE